MVSLYSSSMRGAENPAMEHYQRIKREYRRCRRDSRILFQTVLSVADYVDWEAAWGYLELCVIEKRLKWLDEHMTVLKRSGNPLEDGYRTFYEEYLGVSIPKDGEMTEKTERQLVMRWWNACPTLEACKELGLDTREICKTVYNRPAQVFLTRIDQRLRFERNYSLLRPHVPYCEEMIILEEPE